MPDLLRFTRKTAAAALLATLLTACQHGPIARDPVPALTAEVYRARLYERPAPLLGEAHAALPAESAYRIQRGVLEPLLGQRFFGGAVPDGFRASLTTPAAQAQFGQGPIAGVLLPGSALAAAEDGFHVRRDRFRAPLIEVELGFRVGSRITAPVADVAALRELVVEVAPVIELPDPGQAAPGKPSVTDLIVNNIFAAAYLAGPGRAPAWTAPEQVTVTLYRDGEELASAAASRQWETLLWLVNHTVAQGWTIEPESLLLTGALAAPLPLKRGLHVADFGDLGRLELWVE